jgi:hypothetical protein
MQAVVASLRRRDFRRAYPHPILYHASRRSVSKACFWGRRRASMLSRTWTWSVRVDATSTEFWRSTTASHSLCDTSRSGSESLERAKPAPCSKTPISAPRPDRRGAGCGRDVKGWEHVRRPLAEAFDRSGTWLDVGCANGYLLETLPAWLIERGITVEPFGLELIPTVADLARSRLPRLAERIYTGDVTEWEPPRRWMFVTVLTDAVPPSGLRSLVRRLLDRFVEPGGRLIVSS